DKGADSFRKMSLVTTTASDIKQIKITKPDGSTIALQKNGTNWQITQPTNMPADETAASDLAYALAGVRAESFVPAKSVPSSAFARPQMTVAFTSAAPVIPPATAPSTAPVWTTVEFGTYDSMLKKNVYARVGDAVAKVSATSLDSFKK